MRRLISLLFHDVYERHPSESGFLDPGADRYKLTVPAFQAQLRNLADARKDGPILVTTLSQHERLPVPLAITVDDGGSSYYIRVAQCLESLGWRAHCFVTTSFIGQRGFLDKGQIRDLEQRGHLIGSHSVSHPRRFSACSWNEMVREWRESRKVLEDVLGQEVTVASVPGGYFSPSVAMAARESGLKVLFTSEPETRVRNVAGCLVIGRFTIRRGCHQDFSRNLGMLEPSTCLREWTTWNAKKVLKALLGPAYPYLAGWASSHY